LKVAFLHVSFIRPSSIKQKEFLKAPFREELKDNYDLFGIQNNYKDELDPKCERNFLILCGTKGSSTNQGKTTKYNSCQLLFDHFELTILYDPFQRGYRYWRLKPGHPLYNGKNPYGGEVQLQRSHQPYRRLLIWRCRQAKLQRLIMYSGFKLAELLRYEALSLETTSVSSDKQPMKFQTETVQSCSSRYDV
jgi:hypothetical protein